MSLDFENFLRSKQEALYKVALLQLGDRDLALDMVQETMISLLKHYRNKNSEELNYLSFKVLNSKIRNWSRKNWLFRASSVFRNEEHTVNEKNSEVILIELQQSKEISKLLKSILSKNQYQVVFLKIYGENTFEDISKIMKMNLSTVKEHYYRAVKKLKAQRELCHEF